MRNNLQLILFRLLLLLRCVAQHKCSLANSYFFIHLAFSCNLFYSRVYILLNITCCLLTVDIVRCILCCWCCDCCCLYSLPFQWFACQTKEEEKNSDWMQLLVFQQIFNQTEWKRNEMKWKERDICVFLSVNRDFRSVWSNGEVGLMQLLICWIPNTIKEREQ